MGASGPGRSDSTVDAMAAVVIVAVVVGTVAFWLAGMPS